MAKKQLPNLIVPQSTEKGFITKLAEEESKKKIEAGEYFDPEYIDTHGQGAEADYSGIDTFYGQLDKDAFDKYEDYIGEGVLKGGQFNFDELSEIRAKNAPTDSTNPEPLLIHQPKSPRFIGLAFSS